MDLFVVLGNHNNPEPNVSWKMVQTFIFAPWQLIFFEKA